MSKESRSPFQMLITSVYSHLLQSSFRLVCVRQCFLLYDIFTLIIMVIIFTHFLTFIENLQVMSEEWDLFPESWLSLSWLKTNLHCELKGHWIGEDKRQIHWWYTDEDDEERIPSVFGLQWHQQEEKRSKGFSFTFLPSHAFGPWLDCCGSGLEGILPHVFLSLLSHLSNRYVTKYIWLDDGKTRETTINPPPNLSAVIW